VGHCEGRTGGRGWRRRGRRDRYPRQHVRLTGTAEDFRASQGAAERLIDQLERLIEETEQFAAALEDDDLSTGSRALGESLLRRGERAMLRYDYLSRTAVTQLAELRSGLKSGSRTSDADRRLRDVEAAELRLHGALDEVRRMEVAGAFARLGQLRSQLSG
jgi:hypothetical protein